MTHTSPKQESGDSPQPVTRLDDGSILALAPAKLNLNLLVGRPRDDGYHPLDSIVVKVSLYDELRVRARDDEEIALRCEGDDCGPAADNLVVRAAAALNESPGRRGADIHLAKRIPPGMGLGGGSSDAAAALRALTVAWALDLADDELLRHAAALGSDVPLFLGPPAARMTGRGEHLQPVELHPFAALVILPEFACSTPDVYRSFDEHPETMPRQLPAELLAQPPSRWRGLLRNQLAAAACRVQPRLGEWMATLEGVLPPPVCVTGSGAGLFCLCDELDEAVALLDRLPPDLPGGAVVVQPCPW